MSLMPGSGGEPILPFESKTTNPHQLVTIKDQQKLSECENHAFASGCVSIESATLNGGSKVFELGCFLQMFY